MATSGLLVIPYRERLGDAGGSLAFRCRRGLPLFHTGPCPNLPLFITPVHNLSASQTMSSTIGRNDPCVCGSGKKYKRCCQEEGRSATATAASKTTMIVLGALVLIGLVFMVISVVGGGEGACPPGQSWSAAHGHCH